MNSPGAYLYVLYGEDTFSRDEALRGLKERMRALPAGEHNLTVLEGSEATVAGLRAAADAMPFLAERRMVVVHGLLGRLQGRGGRTAARGRTRKAGGDSTAADEYAALLAYLEGVPETTSIAFVEGASVSPDAVLGAVPKGRGFAREFPRVQDVAGWVRQRARAIEVEVDEAAVRELALLGGDDLRRLDAELRKLAAYADGRPVTRADVREMVVGRDVAIWGLLDALVERRRDRAVASLRRLYGQGEPPEALLLRDIGPLYRRLLAARELSLLDRRARQAVDPGGLGLNPRTLPRLMEQAEQYEVHELQRALELLLDLDRRVKTGETEPDAALELAVVQLCSRLAAA